ncbi:hypothetical protein KSP40_PGU004919 [Platanthera guangdongensis]|uniref:Pentatricopeptide repeat-containing protein n=1 Tax=Platanthera guangdongensis TaxID=2320717 RepID=A0ABR2MJB8_9ASPA
MPLCREGRIDEASNLVQEMENNGMVLDAVLYTSWMCGYFRKGLLMDGFLKHSLMGRNGVMADVVSYTALIDGLCKEGHFEKVIGVFCAYEEERIETKFVYPYFYHSRFLQAIEDG